MPNKTKPAAPLAPVWVDDFPERAGRYRWRLHPGAFEHNVRIARVGDGFVTTCHTADLRQVLAGGQWRPAA